MHTKHICVLIHIRIKGEDGTVKTCLSPPVIVLVTVPMLCFFCGFFLSLMFHVCLYYTVLSVP